MLAKIYSAAAYGIDAYEIEIEVNAGGGPPMIVVVGLPDTAVKESKDRVTTGIGNSGYYWPRGRTTINLAPADIKKEGPSFDLPIALGMIAVSEDLDGPTLENFSFVGELALNGAVRPVKGVLPVAIEARRRGKKALFVPAANAREASMIDGIDIYGVQNLRQTFEFIRGETTTLQPTRGDLTDFFANHQSYEVDFSDVKGQGTSSARSRWWSRAGIICSCYGLFHLFIMKAVFSLVTRPPKSNFCCYPDRRLRKRQRPKNSAAEYPLPLR